MAGIESLLIGRVLGGRYRIEEVIGRGGMGAVYRALDERLGRRVALKVITVAGGGDPVAKERLRARFFREARSAAALPHHPNVVPVYDYGSDEDLDLDYLVMELLHGSDLASRLARAGTLPLPAALRILVEAARGLAVGHRQGLIHRDVKPGNIFLTQPHGHEVQVRVVDFGIAKLADDDDTLAQLTQDGRVPHSPAYASPEQLRGLTQLTPAADVFSLGAVGYQLLTGERPFSDSDRNRLSLGMPVDAPSVRERNPAVPASVDSVIRRALAFEPADRFPDAAAMATELESALRSMGEAPIDPYIGGAPIISAADAVAGRGTRATGPVDSNGKEDDDRTRVIELEDEDRTRPFAASDDEDRTQLAAVDDDRTLVAPPQPPTSRIGPRFAKQPLERKPLPPRPPPRRDRSRAGGIIVWSLVFALLLAAGLWAWSEIDREPAPVTVVEPVDSVEVIPEDTVPTVDPIAQAALEMSNDGYRALLAGNYAEAARFYRRAVDLAPDDVDYRRNLAIALSRANDLGAAERELREVIRRAPEDFRTYVNLGDVQLARTDTAAAIASFEEALARGPSQDGRLGIEARLREIEAARSNVPLLGDPVPVPSVGDTPVVPAQPGGR